MADRAARKDALTTAVAKANKRNTKNPKAKHARFTHMTPGRMADIVNDLHNRGYELQGKSGRDGPIVFKQANSSVSKGKVVKMSGKKK